jgi:hypothetical protein
MSERWPTIILEFIVAILAIVWIAAAIILFINTIN